MKLSLIQMNASQDRDPPVARACQFIDQAAQKGSELIVLPEFFNTLYFAQYRDYKYVEWAERDDGYTMTRVRDKARQHGTYIIATIYEEENPGLYYDTAMVVDPAGQIVGKYRKTHPGSFRALEKIYFRPGSKYPVFRIHDWTVGIIICYDLSFPESARCVMLNGAELVVVPFCAPAGYLSPATSNLPSSTGKESIDLEASLRRWEMQMTIRASENIVYLAPCNHVGQEGDAIMIGGTRIVDPRGRIVAAAGADEEVIYADLDRDLFVETRRITPFLRDRRPDLYKAITTETDDLPL